MIPNIIHQLWIGDVSAPSKHMNTWKNKNKQMDYIRWNESEIIKLSEMVRLELKSELS